MKKLDFKINENGCFICTSHYKNKEGYTRMRKNGKKTLIHRHIYEECFGEIPKDLVIRHKCDNPTCINPEHLELGTIQDNVNDRMKRKRHKSPNKKGENHHMNKLKECDVIYIRKSNESRKVLSKKFKVSECTISDIRNRKTWKEVE